MNPIRDIKWQEKSQIVDSILKYSNSLTVVPLDAGLEAEVTRIDLDETSLVLKVWNRSSRPNVESQYKLLQALFNRGLSVSQPLGWGMDQDDHQVLLTYFDGTPVRKVNKSLLMDLAQMLSAIHQFPVECVVDHVIPKYDFIRYFYPSIEEHKDIQVLLNQLVERSHMKQNKLIHGDFNLSNILEADGKYTVIDWTNGQWGDPRYDIAWSVVLIRIYVSQRYGTMYRSAFLSGNPYTIDELELFEAIACLRWILLHRLIGLSDGNETMTRVRNILKENIYLTENLI
jgi:aminoglycoside phosphotransferase (APT) family kinase protein